MNTHDYKCISHLFVCLQSTSNLFKLLDNALDNKNRISFASLQESGRVGSEGVLNNVEQYAHYLAKAMGCQVSGHYSIIGSNIGVCNTCSHLIELYVHVSNMYIHICRQYRNHSKPLPSNV